MDDKSPEPRAGSGNDLAGASAGLTTADTAPALRAERDLRRMLELSGDLLAVAGPDDRYRRVSPAFTRVLGWTEQELLSQPGSFFVHPDDLERTAGELAHLGEGRSSVVFENRYRHRDGSYRWLSWTAASVPEEGLIYAAGRDVTARKRDAQALAGSQTGLAAILEHLPVAVGVLAYDGRLTLSNAPMRALAPGLMPWDGPVQQRAWRAVDGDGQPLPPDEWPGARALRGEAVPDGVELTLAGDDARERCVLVSAVPFRSPDDARCGALLVALDITERKHSAAQVQTQRMFVDAVLDHLEEAVIVCDAEGRLVRFNKAAEDFHGRRASREQAESWGREFFLFQTDGTTPLRTEDVPLARALAGEHVRGAELVIAPPDGPSRLVQASGRRLVDDEGTVMGAFITLQDLTDRRQAELLLAHQALHDPLTALPNRRLLLDRAAQALHRARRSGRRPALLFCDLDRFKVVNDSLGHDIGDLVLTQVAQRLQAVVRPQDTVARIGGDEFVVLCDDVADISEAALIGERIEAVFSEPFHLGPGRGTCRVSSSIGVALAEPDDRPDDLLRKSDQAMYHGKALGRGGRHLFDERLGRRADARLRAETELRAAISQDRLALRYQPIVDLASGEIVACEALVRFIDADGDLVPPAQFLSVAENTGLIVEVGRWVVEQVRGPARERLTVALHLPISVNLSARQLADANLVEALTSAAAGAGGLNLEITESVLMDVDVPVVGLLERLKASGHVLGLDDFGTGYSSLTYLRQFPVDFVKIDRSFVAGMGRNRDDTAIVTAVIGLAHALELICVAEGVESAEQLQLLRELGCDQAQGYHLSRPVDLAAVEALLKP